MSQYLFKLYAKPRFKDLKTVSEIALRFLPEQVSNRAKQAKGLLKGCAVGGTLFEQLGFTYIGPIDGHDMDQLLPVLRMVKDRATGPTLIHVITQKGKCYGPAEAAPDKGHATAKFDVLTGKQQKTASNVPSYTKFFAQTLIDLAARDNEICAITAGMPDGTGLDLFTKRFAERCFDVGIAE